MEYSAIGGATTNQRAKRHKIDVKTICELADLSCYRRYSHRHAVINKLELVTLSNISDMKNALTKCTENAFSNRKKSVTRSNDRVEKAKLRLLGAPSYWGVYEVQATFLSLLG
ncbi:hypothetical protein XI08_19190 [Bradyrhizobium sp. CCBAU 11361]|nr:hypothetical protein [Bradyrhizobium sp. CCBAU 11361]